jgi:hypothetical protein
VKYSLEIYLKNGNKIEVMDENEESLETSQKNINSIFSCKYIISLKVTDNGIPHLLSIRPSDISAISYKPFIPEETDVITDKK